MINDSISPIPNFQIKVSVIDDLTLLILQIKKGKDTPYYYKGKAFKRGDTSTIEVGR